VPIRREENKPGWGKAEEVSRRDLPEKEVLNKGFHERSALPNKKGRSLGGVFCGGGFLVEKARKLKGVCEATEKERVNHTNGGEIYEWQRDRAGGDETIGRGKPTRTSRKQVVLLSRILLEGLIPR